MWPGMDNETLEGKVQRTASQPGKHGIKIDGEWYNLSRYADEEVKDKQREIEEDDIVKLDLDQPESGFYEKIISVGKPEDNDVSSEPENNEDGDNGREKGSVENDTGDKTSVSDQSSYQSKKDDQIAKKVAFKEAAATVRERDANMGEGQHIEEVSKFANGYYNILKGMGDGQ